MQGDLAKNRPPGGAKPDANSLDFAANPRPCATQGYSGELKAVSAQLETIPNHKPVTLKTLSVEKRPCRTLVAHQKIRALAPEQQMAPRDPAVL